MPFAVDTDTRRRRIEQMASHLMRVPFLKQTQLARLIGQDRKDVFRLVRDSPEVFEVIRYRRKQHGHLCAEVRPSGPMDIVRLTTDAKNKWSEKLSLHVPYRISHHNISRVLTVGEVYTRMQETSQVHQGWMLRVSQPREPVHAWVQWADKDKVALYVLPQDEELFSTPRQIAGILHKVKQYTEAQSIALLVQRKHYSKVMNKLLRIKNDRPIDLMLWPWEDFLYEPEPYLRGALDNDVERLRAALPMIARRDSKVPTEFGTKFGRLVQLRNGEYQLIDIFTNGKIQRIADWEGLETDKVISIDGQSVYGYVYVRDQCVLDSLNARFSRKPTMVSFHRLGDLYKKREGEGRWIGYE